MLTCSIESDSHILSDFYCGISAMDLFIHGLLASFLRHDQRYQLFVVREDTTEEIVAMYVIISNGLFVDANNEYDYLPLGKPWAYFDDNLEFHEGTMFPTLEIDYLAVREDLRGKGYGRWILGELSKMAAQKGVFFLTVEAYYNQEYSAVPFYEKNGFFLLQEISQDNNAVRMAMRIAL